VAYYRLGWDGDDKKQVDWDGLVSSDRGENDVGGILI
jgi:hypothetical protein